MLAVLKSIREHWKIISGLLFWQIALTTSELEQERNKSHQGKSNMDLYGIYIFNTSSRNECYILR